MARARNRVCSQPGCPRIQPDPLCPEHRRARDAHQRATVPTKVTYTHSERIRRKATVDAWRTENGDVCPGYEGPAHPSDRLTADHVTPIALGGRPDGPLGVLCVSCNARKGARVQRGADTRR